MSLKLEKRYPQKRIFITGGASGLGLALAVKFASEGWKTAVGDVNKERLLEAERKIAEKGGTPLAIVCDVTNEQDLVDAAGVVTGKWGGVDIVVNNAGIANGGTIEKIPQSEWDRIIGINLLGVVRGCRAFVPMLKSQGGGHIVNIASAAGFVSLPEMSAYNSTKAAVISLSETLRIELAPHKIGVTVACPTFIPTNLMESFHSPDERQRRLAQKMFKASRQTAGQFAERVHRAIAKNRLYELPGSEGKLLWLLKRASPEVFYRFFSRGYSKSRNVMDKAGQSQR